MDTTRRRTSAGGAARRGPLAPLTLLTLLTLLALLAACSDGSERGPSVTAPPATDPTLPTTPTVPVPPVPTAPVWREVVTALGGTCAGDSAGGVHCVSTLAQGAPRSLTPLAVGEPLSGLTMGDGTMCGLTRSGRLRCRSLAGASYAIADGGIALVRISGDAAGGCGVTAAGEAYCWSASGGPAPDTARLRRVPAAPPLTAVSVRRDAACALTSDGPADAGRAYCWSIGALLLRDEPPRRVPTELRFASVSVGIGHVCALSREGEAYCWGDNTSAALGVPRGQAAAGCTSSTIPYPSSGCETPQRVATSLRFRAIGASWSHTCALAIDGRAYCWGVNYATILGTTELPEGDTCRLGSHFPCTPTPMAIPGGLTFETLGAAAGPHVCATASGGRVYCWGDVAADGTPRFAGLVGGAGTPTPVRLGAAPAAGG